MKYLFFLFIFTVLICHYSYSQNNNNEFRVVFKDKIQNSSDRYTSSSMMPSEKIEDPSSFKGIPLQFPLYTIFSVIINHEIKMHDKYKSGQISKTEYTNYLREIDSDTTFLDRQISCYKNKFHIYVGLDEIKNEKHIIVDSNNNLDFSDDKIYTFSTEDYDKKSWFSVGDSLSLHLQVNISYPNDKNHSSNKINVTIHPYDAYNGEKDYLSKEEYHMNILVCTNHYKQASIKIDNEDLYINGFDNRLSFIPENSISNKSTFYLFCPQDSIYPNTSKIGDTVLVANRRLYLQEKKGDLYIKDLGPLLDSSRIGSNLPLLYSRNINDNQVININKLSDNKYVFIDFWGSWCRPCIASIPKLKDLYQKIKEKENILMLGIAQEIDKKDIYKLKKAINDNEIEWLNLWLSSEESKINTSIIKKLNINAFPTYLIIDNKGKIVYKEKSMFKTDEAISYFLNLIEQ